jgi:hypothetical protein
VVDVVVAQAGGREYFGGGYWALFEEPREEATEQR